MRRNLRFDLDGFSEVPARLDPQAMARRVVTMSTDLTRHTDWRVDDRDSTEPLRCC